MTELGGFHADEWIVEVGSFWCFFFDIESLGKKFGDESEVG